MSAAPVSVATSNPKVLIYLYLESDSSSFGVELSLLQWKILQTWLWGAESGLQPIEVVPTIVRDQLGLYYWYEPKDWKPQF